MTAAVRAHLPAFDSLQRLAEKMSADDVLSLVNSVRATLETDLQETYKGGNGNGNGGSGESRLNGHAVAGSNEDGGDAAGGDFKQRDDVLSLYLLREMSDEHGAIPEGDQLHVLLDEVIATLKSSAYRLTLADLIHIAFETLDTETHVVIARQSDAVKDGEAGAVGTAGEAGAAGAAAAAAAVASLPVVTTNRTAAAGDRSRRIITSSLARPRRADRSSRSATVWVPTATP